MRKEPKPKLPTTRESLASISRSLQRIADSLTDNKGDYALATLVEALWDMAEYGAGKAPKGHYDWRHGNS